MAEVDKIRMENEVDPDRLFRSEQNRSAVKDAFDTLYAAAKRQYTETGSIAHFYDQTNIAIIRKDNSIENDAHASLTIRHTPDESGEMKITLKLFTDIAHGGPIASRSFTIVDRSTPKAESAIDVTRPFASSGLGSALFDIGEDVLRKIFQETNVTKSPDLQVTVIDGSTPRRWASRQAEARGYVPAESEQGKTSFEKIIPLTNRE